MRGIARLMRRSKNSHIRSPRKVTMQPIDMPSRSLNAAIERRALVMTGRWPAINWRSPTAPSSSDCCWVALPTPMLMTILVSRGTCITLDRPSSLASAGRISVS